MVSISSISSLFVIPSPLIIWYWIMNLMLEFVFVVSQKRTKLLKLNISESGAGFPSGLGSASRRPIVSRINILIVCWRRWRRNRRHSSAHAQRIWRKNWKLGWRGGRRRQVVVVKLGGVGSSCARQAGGKLLTGCPRYASGGRAGAVEAIGVLQVVLRIWKINLLNFAYNLTINNN